MACTSCGCALSLSPQLPATAPNILTGQYQSHNDQRLFERRYRLPILTYRTAELETHSVHVRLDPIAMTHTNQASLLGLPAELRNIIYGHSFGYGDCQYYNLVRTFVAIQHCRCFGLGLMQVCQQTRSENFKLFYENYDFRFNLDHAKNHAIETWLGIQATEG